MTAFVTPSLVASATLHRHQARPKGFALVVTLLIVSLLAIVAVSFLTSMSSERQTADAFSSKSRAEQAAQTGVDAAEAILAQSFRDFPDSCTVWDTKQTLNSGKMDGSTVPGTPDPTTGLYYNEGTSLYLRAMPSSSGVADPQYTGKAVAADSLTGNNPNDLNCKTFKLPLISGVPGGNAQLASTTPLATDLTVLDPSKQTDSTKAYCTDLNVRRSQSDVQGAIGSPPGWNSTVGPKPARANWVNLKGNDGKVTGRYAFWVDDESFRANISLAGNTTASPSGNTVPPDNLMRPMVGSSSVPRSAQPSDLILPGPLTKINDSNAGTDATALLTTRAEYPGDFFPDLLAFTHAVKIDGTAAFSPALVDALRYVTTNQSGTLNVTRHGTQRLNLNNVIPSSATVADRYAVAPATTVQSQIDEIVQTLKFHLPYFGERFYRTSTDAKPTTLNSPSQVLGSPKTSPYTVLTNPNDPNIASEIYYYKVAANIHDYVDSDLQPTIIDSGGVVRSPGKPLEPLNVDGNGNGNIWAQGKEMAPYIQEVAVRLRPTVSKNPIPSDATNPHRYDLRIDFYVEVWNMSDRDISASPNPSDSGQPNLHGATIRVTNQSVWEMSPSPYGDVPSDDGTYRLSRGGAYTDCEFDLTAGVRLGGANGPMVGPDGVVFKAGTVTVLTTDPDCANYVFYSPAGAPSSTTCMSGIPFNIPGTANRYGCNPAATYYCPTLLQGQREYTGQLPAGVDQQHPGPKGIEMNFKREQPPYRYDYETEVTLGNAYGVLDSVPYAIDESYYRSTWYSDPAPVPPVYPSYQDYSYSSCLMGNMYDTGLHFDALPSELGDPRTNNEQMSLQPYVANGTGDQSHYIYATGFDTSLGYYNTSQRPGYLGPQPVGTRSAYPWPDFFDLAGPQTPPLGTTNPMNATNAPMVIADGPLSSIAQLGDVFDPARLPGTGGIALSRGGGRTFKIGQRDDRYCGDPTGNVAANNGADAVPASNAWAAWRLTDVFSVDDPIELPARININGVLRDNGAALLAALQGFQFQPATNSSDPVIHGDNHAPTSLASKPLDTINQSAGFFQLIAAMKARLTNTHPTNPNDGPYLPSGPFFERGEFGEINDTGGNALFGMSDPLMATNTGSSGALVSGANPYLNFDHSREELFRRISELICTRGDTFTVYAVGQSILQSTAAAPMKVTGTQRMRVTFRLVPQDAQDQPWHPAYRGEVPNIQLVPSVDVLRNGRFAKADHYAAQVLSVSAY